MTPPNDSTTLTVIQKAHVTLLALFDSGSIMDRPHQIQEKAVDLFQALDRYYLQTRQQDTEFQAAIDKFNDALDGDSNDDECDAAIELRDLVICHVAGEDVNLPTSNRMALVKAEAFISGFEDDDLQEGVPELLALLRAEIPSAE